MFLYENPGKIFVALKPFLTYKKPNLLMKKRDILDLIQITIFEKHCKENEKTNHRL